MDEQDTAGQDDFFSADSVLNFRSACEEGELDDVAQSLGLWGLSDAARQGVLRERPELLGRPSNEKLPDS